MQEAQLGMVEQGKQEIRKFYSGITLIKFSVGHANEHPPDPSSAKALEKELIVLACPLNLEVSFSVKEGSEALNAEYIAPL